MVLVSAKVHEEGFEGWIGFQQNQPGNMGIAGTVGAPPRSSWIALLALRAALSASVLVCL